MTEWKYDVCKGNAVVAKEMDLDIALALIDGLFNKFPNEPSLSVTIERIPKNKISREVPILG